MPVYRDKDGNIIEEPTNFEGHKRNKAKKKKGIRGQDANDRFAAPTKKADRSSEPSNAKEKSPTDDRFHKPTSRSGEKPGAKEPLNRAEQPHTRLLRRSGKPSRPSSPNRESSSADASKDESVEDDVSKLVTGWLVIVDGPGRGTALKLGYGSNAIGRGETNRVSVDFGDSSITRENHAILTYDGRGRQFYIQHGGGVNVTYLEDDPVLAPTKIRAMQRLSLGDTEFAFIPFCGPEFDWNDEDEDS